MVWLHLLLVCGGVWVQASPVFEQPTPLSVETCGYASCTQADRGSMLNVHIVPHSHDDVGWLKTVDQYYYGSRNDIQKAGVQYILDSVIQELWEDPKRRFIYVETFFFWKWWMKQSDHVRHKVHTLVREGRLQMVGGAWSMNDEASAHYHSTIDQFTWGLSKLNQTFGTCGMPRVGWQIDPFGHSREFASLLAGMGYDGLFLGRIDYQDKNERKRMNSMEMLWRGDDNIGKSSDLFTGVLYNRYSPPPGFCFDILCQDEPIIDDFHSPMYNVDERVTEFVKIVSDMAKSYATRNVLVTMGEDFQYQDAATWFVNLDKLIEYTNMKAAKEQLNVKLFYSTPDCYLKAVKDADPTLPTKQDDFFPYASDPTAFWTGYFTSRPTTKYFERQGNVYLQMAKQLQVLAGLEEHNMFVINELKSAMGIMQHHDAITGTEKQHVANDYVRILDNAVEDSLIVPREAFNKFMQGSEGKMPLLYFNRCQLNESSCDTSEQNDQFIVTVYNSLGWDLKEPIRIPVTGEQYEVFAPNGEKIQSQVVDLPEYFTDIPTRFSQATREIVFIAHLHPMSYKNFFIQKANKIVKRSTQDDTEIPPAFKIKDGEKNKKREFYFNEMNEYWKKVKQQPEIDIKNLEEQTIKNSDKDIRIPIEPVSNINVDSRDFGNADLNVLSDAKTHYNPDMEQFDKLIREAKKLIHETQHALHKDRSTPNRMFVGLNDDEMRMLSDDPQLVERFPRDLYLENQHLKLRVNSAKGKVFVASLADGTEITLNLKYAYYPGCYGDNYSYANRSSGAYIFRPNATAPIDANTQIVKGPEGPVVKEMRVTSDSYIASIIRIYDELDYIENDWVVGPIDIEDGVGKEYVVRYVTDIINNGEFYTDSSGRQMLKRKLGKRPQWNVTLQEPIAGNYYPVTNKIAINDDKVRLAVLTDRSEGGSSLQEGELEVMLHRRLLHDDAFGVGEALNETAAGKGLVVRGTHRLYVTKPDRKSDYITEKKRMIEADMRPLVFVSKTNDLSLENWLKLKNCHSWVNALPDGLHLLTLEHWRGNTILLRLENYLELSDKDQSTIQIDLNSIFNSLKLKKFRETTLAANMWLEDVKKWSWKTDDDFQKNFNQAYGTDNFVKADDIVENARDDGFKINIKAKQIRTFIAEFELNKK